jgi:glycosyltransferase involved in cell wall biosynthesis
MRILVFHGYLLHGTGSNVYNARLAAALAAAGHEVDLLSQDRAPEDFSFVDAVGTWPAGAPMVRVLREPVRVTAWRPEIGGLLPVYVADRYEGIEARTFAQLTDAEVDAYVARNVAAVRDVVARARPDMALANHLVMGPLILAHALAGTAVPYVVKIHGSALEYTVKREPERFLPAAREGLAGATAVLVGSRHTAESLWDALGDPDLRARTRLNPPGVDVREFRPREPAQAAADVRAVAERLLDAPPAPAAASAFARDARAAGRALASLDFANDRHVAFTGKLILEKGIDLLAAAWPLVLAGEPRARLVIVGFGEWRQGLEAMLRALSTGDLEAVRAHGPRHHLRAFLDALDRDPSRRTAYLRAATALESRIVLTGRLDHHELAPLLAACEAQVVPSTFPEAFGMVAAEAAACGALPISAGHSGLAEVAATLAPALPPQTRPLLCFPLDDGAVETIAQRVLDWLRVGPDVRAQTRAALVATARARYSWAGVAEGLIEAAGVRPSR